MNISVLAPEILKSAIAGLSVDDVDIAVNNGYVLLDSTMLGVIVRADAFDDVDDDHDEMFMPDDFEDDEGPHPMSEKDEFWA